MEVKVLNISGKSEAKLTLSADIFGQPVRPDIVARVIRWQLAKRRQGTHASKGISDVSGTTRKPYKQKGTGRARQGSLRSAQFRGGGCIFGPVVRSHEHDMPKKVRKMALRSVFSDKLKNDRLFVCDFSGLKGGKTKGLLEAFKAMNIAPESALIIDGQQVADALRMAASNMKSVDCLPQIGSNVYDVVRRETLILTPEAVKLLEERLK